MKVVGRARRNGQGAGVLEIVIECMRNRTTGENDIRCGWDAGTAGVVDEDIHGWSLERASGTIISQWS